MTATDNSSEFQTIKTARAWLSDKFGDMTKRPNRLTADEYVQDARRLKARGADLWLTVLDTTSKNTFFKRRAAVHFYCMCSLESMLKKQNLLQRDPNSRADWLDSVAKIKSMMLFLDRSPTADSLLIVKKRASKKKNLRDLPADWREVMVERMPNYRDCLLVCALTGCRPIELERHGVEVTLTNGILKLRILGAKIGPNSGQEWREISYKNDSTSKNPLVRVLSDMVLATNGVALISISDTRAFSGAVRAAGKRAFPEFSENITPYSFRHQMSSDMKAAGFGPDVGAALGHCSSETACRYGEFRQGSGSMAPDYGVKAARLVQLPLAKAFKNGGSMIRP